MREIFINIHFKNLFTQNYKRKNLLLIKAICAIITP